MTVTPEQAQKLTDLAIAMRPYGAPTWDAAGVMAAIKQMREWSLSEVMMRVAVAASDREAKTPAVMVSPGMQIPAPKPPPYKPTNKRDDNGRCADCGLLEARCAELQRVNGKHEFRSAADNYEATARDGEAMALIVRDLRERMAVTVAAPDAAEAAGSGADHD